MLAKKLFYCVVTKMAAPFCKFRFHLLAPALSKTFKSRVKLCSSLQQTGLWRRSLSSDQLFINQYGDPNSVVKVNTVEVPSQVSGKEILVKMMMAPINPSDINTIEGTYFIKPPLPTVPGNEGVGKIVEIGNDVRGLEIGDHVIPAQAAWGTWQNYKISSEDDVIKLPTDVPVLSAATISVNPCTAYRMLKDYVKLSPGDVIIQNGANSGVGVSVIQLCRVWNITTINIVRDRPDLNQLKEYLCSLGADHVLTEEYARSSEMREFLKSLPKKPRLALNCVGGQSATELSRHVGQGGVIVTYGGMSKRPVIVPTGALIFKEISLHGYWNTKWNEENRDNLKRFEMLADLCSLMKQLKFLPPQCDFYQLKDFSKALNEATKGFRNRKIVFKMEE